MSDNPFAFTDSPVEPVQPGRSVLVTGSSRLGSRLAQELVFAGDHDDGVVYVSTNNSGPSVVADIEFAYPDVDLSGVGIIDATGRGNRETSTSACIETVSSTGDLTGISIKNSILSSSLETQGVDRVRTCFDSLSLLLLYTDFRTILRFVHTVSGRISATDGIGVFVLDPSMHEPQVKYTLKNLCDGEISIRYESEHPEIKIEGLQEQPRGWQPTEL